MSEKSTKSGHKQAMSEMREANETQREGGTFDAALERSREAVEQRLREQTREAIEAMSLAEQIATAVEALTPSDEFIAESVLEGIGGMDEGARELVRPLVADAVVKYRGSLRPTPLGTRQGRHVQQGSVRLLGVHLREVAWEDGGYPTLEIEIPSHLWEIVSTEEGDGVMVVTLDTLKLRS